MKFRKCLIALPVVLLFCCINPMYAQPGGGGNPDPPDPKVPLTGVEWLLIAGAALGVKKIAGKKAEK